MRLLTIAVTALGVLGFAGTASAMCGGYAKPAADQTAETPILIVPGTTGS